MRVTCDNCGAGYTLPDHKLSPGRRVQFNCRHCSHRVVVSVPAEEVVAGPIQPAAASREPRWFVANADGSYQKLAESEVAALIDSGELAAATLIWRKGFGEWAPAGQTAPWVERFAQRAAASAPPSAQASPAPPPAAQPVRRASAAHSAPPAAQPSGPRRSRPRRKTDRGPAGAADAAGADNATLAGQASVVGTAGPSRGQEAVSLPIIRPNRAPSGVVPSRQPRPSPRRTSGTHRAPSGVASGPQPAAPAASAAPAPQVSVRVNAAHLQPGGQQHADGAGGRSAASRRSPSQRVDNRRPPSQATQAPRGPAGARGPEESGRFAPGAQPSGTPMDGGARPDDGTAWSPATDTYIGPRDRFTHRIGSDQERRHLLAQVEREGRLRRELRRWQWVALATAAVAIVAFGVAIFGLVGMRMAEKRAAACAPRGAESSVDSKPASDANDEHDKAKDEAKDESAEAGGPTSPAPASDEGPDH